MLMKLQIDRTLFTTHGHTIQFVKDQPTHVPSIAVADAAAIGAIAVGTDDNLAEALLGDTPAPAVPVNNLDRDASILAAIETLVDRNHRSDFTPAGLPKAAALEKELGYKVDGGEIRRVWDARSEKLASV